MTRSVLVGLSFVAGCLVVAGFLGQQHRSFDTIAMGRPFFGVVCISGMLAARPFWLRLVFALAVAVALFTTARPFLPQQSGGHLRVYSKNLWFANSEIAALVDDIESTGADVVMLQEVSDQNVEVLSLLEKSFPYQHLCGFSGWSGIALLSRHPFQGEPVCSEWRAIAAAPVRIENSKVWLVSAHIPWPWPHDSRNNEIAAERVLADLDGAIVIGGDFNIMPWSGRVLRIASLTNTRLAGPVRPTLTFRHVPLPIDFVLAPGGGSLETRPLFGSDHAGVLAQVRLWAP
ncbi:endonuclease/exonuclease/phosphatase family protein [Dinoroseobacter sp. S76]|uniref:endonuclease/exonuclease/phosphatase family protein n=1 Tax=Dinoroseobacter sp. S76 TaxID=3415124 RepID=UPI003C79F588